MTNLEAAEMVEEDFFAAYEKAKTAEIARKKNAINTATITFDEQIKRFGASSFDEEDLKALYEDARSV